MKDIIYDVFGQRTKLSLGNGVVNEYTYDQNTRRLSHLKSFKGSNVFQNISYKFDAVGNILERVNKDFVTSGSVKKASKQTYEYDNLYRLTASEGEYTKESWLPYFNDRTNIYTSSTSYNRVGNDMRTLKDTTYDREYTYGGAQPHAVTKAGDLVMGYDANGNMTTKEWTKYGVKMSMTWNSENRMTESTVLNASTGGKSITRYKYDHEGNRVVKSGRYGEAVYVNQNYSVRNNTIVSKHIFAGGQRVVSKVCDSDANSIMDTGVFYVSTDHLGSSNLLTDKDGNFYEHVETFPCGDIWVRKGTNNYNISFKFTGHEKDLETMFLYAKERYLDSQQSVWVSTDRAFESYFPDGSQPDKKLPAGGIYNPRNLNVYSYAYNNPVKYVDPDGNFPILYRIANSPIVQRSVRWVSNTPVGRFVGRQTDKLYYAMAAGGRWVVRNAPRAWNAVKNVPGGVRRFFNGNLNGKAHQLLPRINFTGRVGKLTQHAIDWGIKFKGNPRIVAGKMEKIVNHILRSSKVIKQGIWRGGIKDAIFQSNGKHIVVCKPDGTFITVLKNAQNNRWFKNATTIWRK